MSQVAATGFMYAAAGIGVHFGVDHEQVTVTIGDRTAVLDISGQDGFAREFHRAVFLAEAQAEQPCDGPCHHQREAAG